MKLNGVMRKDILCCRDWSHRENCLNVERSRTHKRFPNQMGKVLKMDDYC